tara:strand:+ start:3144 stop:3773 length:630 start_codon:yes stop_codon:yes gene_type:complete
MSNIFTRRSYDTNQVKSDETSNENFNRHIMNINPFENQNGCVNPHIPSQGKGQVSRPLNSEGFLNFRDQTDIENKLRNQHLELNSQLRTNNDYDNVSKNDIGMCEPFNNSVNEDSRFENPISQYREMSPQLRGLHFSPHLHMNPQNVHAENNDMMTAVGRMGVSTRYDSKNGSYVRTNNEYKNLVQNRPSNNLDSFEIEANSLLPSRRN